MLVLKGQLVGPLQILRQGVEQGLCQAMQYLSGMSGGRTKFSGHDLNKLGEPLDVRRIKRFAQGKAQAVKPGQIRSVRQVKMDPVIVIIGMRAAIADICIFIKQDDHIRLRGYALSPDGKPGVGLYDQEQIL